jgi:hypothetical protein
MVMVVVGNVMVLEDSLQIARNAKGKSVILLMNKLS